MKSEIRLPDREPITEWRMALVVTKSNEIIIDREGIDDQEAIALLTEIATMIQRRQG